MPKNRFSLTAGPATVSVNTAQTITPLPVTPRSSPSLGTVTLLASVGRRRSGRRTVSEAQTRVLAALTGSDRRPIIVLIVSKVMSPLVSRASLIASEPVGLVLPREGRALESVYPKERPRRVNRKVARTMPPMNHASPATVTNKSRQVRKLNPTRRISNPLTM